ncbi:MAG TPA: adenylate/guanylate cyclase domain-containing protein [Solirubrobacteraceae bacterium]|nr:adenylate/guanylate cyclase domain-containing protein [Solirubrobacteraceae bacterium]
MALGVGLGSWQLGVLHSLELSTVDARFHLRPDPGAPRDVAVVGIDPATVQRYGHPPLPRRLIARVITRLHASGARIIASDLVFAGRTDPAEDRALEQAISAARPMVLAAQESDGGPRPLLGGQSTAAQLGAVPAAIGIPTDSDHKIRRYFYAPVALPTLAVRAAELARGRRVSERSFPANTALVDFLGPPRTVPTYSLAAVATGGTPAAAFRGRVVVIGNTDPLVQDIVQTPISDTPMPGPELQATAIHTVLAGFPLRSAPTVLDVLIIVLAAVAAPLASLRGSLALTLAITIGAVAAVAIGAQLAFDSGRLVVASYPLLALLTGGSGAVAAELWQERRERLRVRSLFARFVPAGVVDEVIERTDEDLRLGGVRRDGTVLFCDLRGFTTFSEAIEPQRVVEIVNVYMSEMADAVLGQGGTLVSYLGDGLMALFGAPLEQPDHADRALAAAREMVTVRLERFNSWLAAQGIEHRFRMGVGLNSGSVMSGNVGSEARLEYTAMGDTVNTASRVEAMTKDAATQLLLTEATRERLRHPPEELVFVDERPVRGRQATVALWTMPEAR